jgi:RNA polymerase sigma factor (sigma-70 family)
MQNSPASYGDPSWSAGATSFEATYAETVKLLAYIARVRFRIPTEDADSIVQDVYLKFARDYAEIRSPRQWLVAAVSNACRNYLRDRPDETSLPEDAESWEDPRSAGAADAILTRLAVGEALQRLGQRCREMLRLFHFEGQSTQCIADVYGTTANNVQFQLHSCRKKARVVYSSLTKVPE